jgi:hypothetical protein
MTSRDSALKRHLQALKSMRGDGHATPARLKELKRWQRDRLAATYEDFASQPRYREATRFFLEDLYGPKDFSHRDDALMRIMPTMARVLPRSAVETAALAVELEALTEDLDQRVAAALPAGPITEASYAEANREAVTRAEREHQVGLIDAVAERLDALVSKPLVGGTLQLMRAPARAAGLADLQDFLERGFASFRAMKGSTEFMAALREREGAIVNAIFSESPRGRSA